MSRLDYWLSRICKEVAEEQGVSLEEVHEMYDSYLRGIGKAIRRHQQVVIINFGTFRISFRKAHRAMYGIFNRFNRGLITRDQLWERVSYLIGLWNASKYHRPRKGQGYKRRLDEKRKKIYGATAPKPYENTPKGRKQTEEALAKAAENPQLSGGDCTAEQLQHVQFPRRPGHSPRGEGSPSECASGIPCVGEGASVGDAESV